MNKFKNQEELLNIIIKKVNDWNYEYDQLFTSLIPLSFKILNKIKSHSNFYILEEHDFLLITFETYAKLIKKLQANKKALKIEAFIKIFVGNLNNKYHDLIRKIEYNKSNILNHSFSYDNNNYDYIEKIDLNETANDSFNKFIINEFIKTIKSNYLLFKIFLLKVNGKKNNQISKILNLSATTICRKLKLLKQKYDQIYKQHQCDNQFFY